MALSDDELKFLRFLRRVHTIWDNEIEERFRGHCDNDLIAQLFNRDYIHILDTLVEHADGGIVLKRNLALSPKGRTAIDQYLRDRRIRTITTAVEVIGLISAVLGLIVWLA